MLIEHQFGGKIIRNHRESEQDAIVMASKLVCGHPEIKEVRLFEHHKIKTPYATVTPEGVTYQRLPYAMADEWAKLIKGGSRVECVVAVLEEDGDAIFYNQDDEVIAIKSGASRNVVLQLVRALKANGVAARLKETSLVLCGICDCYHPHDFNGDCRDDGNRFPPPTDPDDEAASFDDGTPAGCVERSDSAEEEF